jgi:hypothetical protein
MSKRLIYRHPQSGGVFGRDARISAAGPYVRVGLGAALAAQGPYDLSMNNGPGRVREIKRALRLLGQKAGGPDALWSTLADDDSWEEAACDEFVAFTARYGSHYMSCVAAPYFQSFGDMAWPTMNGLILLDLAYRSATAGGLAWVASATTSCSTGTLSAQTMEQLEAFLTGKTHANFVVELGIDGAGAVQVLPPEPAASWGQRVGSDRPGYDKYQTTLASMQSTWTALGGAKNETEISNLLAVQSTNRVARAAVVQSILNPAGTPGPTPGGTTVVPPDTHCTQGGGLVYNPTTGDCRCPGDMILDATGKQCVCPKGTALDAATNTCKKTGGLIAGLGLDAVPSWVWIGAAGLGLAVLMAKSKKSGKGGKKKRRRPLNTHHAAH